MDIKYPLSETVDNLLRYGVSGGVLLIFLMIAFPKLLSCRLSSWHFFVIFSFIIGFFLFIIARRIIDQDEEEEYYKRVVGGFIRSKFKKELPIHLSRALENYYFWRYNKRANMSKKLFLAFF
jgi:hypothetical protein